MRSSGDISQRASRLFLFRVLNRGINRGLIHPDADTIGNLDHHIDVADLADLAIDSPRRDNAITDLQGLACLLDLLLFLLSIMIAMIMAKEKQEKAVMTKSSCEVAPP